MSYTVCKRDEIIDQFGDSVQRMTEYVVDFILNTNFEDIPRIVLDQGRKSILDGFGLALSGSKAETGKLSRQYVANIGGRGTCSVIGTKMRVPARFAALINGIGIHVDDYDDTQLAVAKDRVYGLLTHPTAPVLPAAFAVGEERQSSGKEFMIGYQLGVEVECKIAEAISPRHYQHGFHTTATCGPFGAVTSACRLRNMSKEQTLQAISVAASQSAGLRENFGTMTKPLHAGRASESGVFASDLVALGWTAAKNILESQRGFFEAAGGGYDPDAILGKLGSPWTFDMPGISIKPHPSGSLTHPGMTKMLELILLNDIQHTDVLRVRVGTNHNMPNTLIHHWPKNELQAKFSMEYCMAILLLKRRAGLSEFTDEIVCQDEVQDMLKRIEFYINEEAEAAGYDKMTTIIDIEMKNGAVISGKADFGKGSPQFPMNYQAVADKFRECAQFANWPKAKTEDIISAVEDIESLPTLSRLTKALSS